MALAEGSPAARRPRSRTRLFREAEERGQAAQALTFTADGVAARPPRHRPAVESGRRGDHRPAPGRCVGRPADVAILVWPQLVADVPIASSGAERAALETLPPEPRRSRAWLDLGVAFEEGTVFAFRESPPSGTSRS